jgi:cullin 1
MMILLLFNNSLEWTIEQIHNQTEIKINLLLEILNILLKSKILTCSQCINQVDLDLNCTIKLSNHFIR